MLKRTLVIASLLAATSAHAQIVWGGESLTSASVAGCPGVAGFGVSLAANSQVLVVGADKACVDGVARGAVVVFDRVGQLWLESDVVERPDGASGDGFGRRVAIDGVTMVASAPGANVIEVYQRLGLRYRAVATLTLPESAPRGSAAPELGAALAADARTVIAGAPGLAPGSANNAGQVIVYGLDDDGTWGVQQSISAESPAANRRFGATLAYSNGILAVGSTVGVSLYERRAVGDSFVFLQELELTGVAGVTLDGDRLVVAKTGAGAAALVYLRGEVGFESDDTLAPVAALSGALSLGTAGLALATTTGVEFVVDGPAGYLSEGIIVGSATSARTVLVTDDGVLVAGATDLVRVHRRVATDGEPCTTAGTCESGFCVDGVCCESSCGAGEVDCRACSVAAGSSEDGRCQIATSGTVCRARVSDCDQPDVCDGIAPECPVDRLEPMGRECRAAAGVCDVPESCTGSSPFCPSDGFESVGVPCRAAAGQCDVPEACDGLRATCPSDRVVTAGQVCRETAGPCDVDERCDGTAPRCPIDTFTRFGFVCRPASAQCDAPETCSGSTAECPVDRLAIDGSACVDGDPCTDGDQCVGGQCQPGADSCPDVEPDPDPDPTVAPDESTTEVVETDTPEKKSDGGCSAGTSSLLALLLALALLARRTRPLALTLALALFSTRARAQDADLDGVLDAQDKCLGPDGVDGDSDGIPSGCDCDDANNQIRPGALDVCNGKDDNCDGLLDVHTALRATGGQLFYMLSHAQAVNQSSRTLSVTNAGQGLAVGGIGSASEFYFKSALTLYTTNGVRRVDIEFDRAARTGDHDFEIGFSDGTNAVLVGLFDFLGTGTAYSPGVDAGTAGASKFTTKQLQSGSSWPEAGPYRASFLATSTNTVVTITNASGQSFVRFVTTYKLSTTGAWSLVMPVNSTPESYVVNNVMVYQRVPATDGTPDADNDGYTASCDCNDAAPGVHPGAVDVCDAVDEDCGGDGDGVTHLTMPGIGIMSDVLLAEAENPSPRALSAEAANVVVGPGTDSAEIFYRRQIDLIGASPGIVVDVTLDRTPHAGDDNLRVGLSDGTRILGASLSRAPDGRYEVGPHWGLDGTARVESATAGASDTLLEAGPYRFSFRLDTVSRVSVTSALGVTLARDYPPAAGTLDLTKPLELVLYAEGADETYRIERLAVTQGPLDADRDGVCDAFDRCIGNDAGPDDDGDGFVLACDCDDTRDTITPMADESCDGFDQDCDGVVDVHRVAGARGSELLGKIADGVADDPSQTGGFAVSGGAELVFPARTTPLSVLYREPLHGVRSGDDPLELTFEVTLGTYPSVQDLMLLVSDGTRAVGSGIVFRAPTGSTIQRPHADAVYADDLDASIAKVSGGTRVDRYVEAVTGLRFTLGIPKAGLTTMRVDLVGLPELISDSYTIPAERMVSLAGPLSILLVAPSTLQYAVRDVRVSQSLADTDLDGVCDARDRCADANDAADADQDGVPDACDVCLGADGLTDLDADGYPSGCDCNDAVAATHPDAADDCNAADDDCDGVTDVHTALRVRGAELIARLASGRATGSARAGVARIGGAAVEFGPTTGPDLDVYYRESLALLPNVGAERRLQIVVDRDTHTDDHDFLIALTDGQRVYGVGLFDVGGSGLRYQAAPITGTDAGTTVALTVGTGVELAERSPYTLDVLLGPDARIEVTTANGDSTTLVATTNEGNRLAIGNLSLILVGHQPTERYVIRSVTVTQSLPDADGDLVCDAIDFCPDENDRGVDSDGDGIVDPCDVCPLGEDRSDGDHDTVPDACDVCDGGNDLEDADHDNLPDDCDDCPEDAANDFDGDGVCDHSDKCLQGSDTADADSDGVPDACDPCPNDPDDDSDEDGTCDSADVCQGDDRSGDEDGDGQCADRDCDDTRAHIHLGAEEICDGFDSDCDGKLGPGELDTDDDLVIDCKQPVVVPEEEPVVEQEARTTSDGCAGGVDASWLLVALVMRVRRRGRVR